jgi:hypothetical protein
MIALLSERMLLSAAIFRRMKPLLAGLAITLVLAGRCLAADFELPTKRPAALMNVTVHNYGAHNPKCVEWTDGCVNCSPGNCSNIGIACQPKEITCVLRQEKPEK